MLVIPPANAHIFITGTPDLGADGKEYRANFVHAPFAENQYAKRRLKRSMVRRLPACETFSRCDPKGT